MSKRQIAQELECNFNTSGETVIDPECMEWLLGNICDPKHRTGFDRNYWIWKPVEEGTEYLLCADVARGDGSDFSVAQVIRLDTMEQVAEYQGKVTSDMFAPLLMSMASEYNNALLVIENNHDYGVLNKIEELGYDNIYYSLKSTHEYVDQATAEARGGVAGFTMSMKTRPLVLSKLEEFIRNKLLILNSLRTVNEIKTFIWHNGRPQGMRGYNDDLVMAFGIAMFMRDTSFKFRQQHLDMSKATLNSISTAKTPFVGGYNNNQNIQNPYEIDNPYGGKEDTSWLL